ncbi:MAG: hypothetical protein K1X83_12885 [Oligoflexia bacterium]|nr:hypothetical protein [Oligoflexia bacterium]
MPDTLNQPQTASVAELNTEPPLTGAPHFGPVGKLLRGTISECSLMLSRLLKTPSLAEDPLIGSHLNLVGYGLCNEREALHHLCESVINFSRIHHHKGSGHALAMALREPNQSSAELASILEAHGYSIESALKKTPTPSDRQSILDTALLQTCALTIIRLSPQNQEFQNRAAVAQRSVALRCLKDLGLDPLVLDEQTNVALLRSLYSDAALKDWK